MNSNSKIKYFNLNEFELSDGDKKKELIINLDNVCKDTGFLLITGHNIDRKIIDNIWSVVDLFFEQPIEFKLKISPPYKGYPYGYLAKGLEALAYSKGEKTPPDLKESFNAGPLLIPDSISE
jgi:Isopenicillin N synthase and related dioxygenases